MTSPSSMTLVAVDHVEHRAVVRVADDAALRRPGRARGVDEGADVLGGDGGDALVEDGRVDLGALGGQLVGGEDVVGVADHHHHLLELRQPGADLADLLHLFLVLDDADLGVGVLEDVGALLGRVGLVDRHDRGADRERRVVEVGPLGAGVAEDRDAVAFLDAERDQAQGQRFDDLEDLLEAAVDPGVAVLVAHRGVGAVRRRRARQQVRQRLRLGPPPLHRRSVYSGVGLGCKTVARRGAGARASRSG